MDIKKLREITEIFTSAGLTELELDDGEVSIKLKKEAAPTLAAPAVYAPAAVVAAPAPESAKSDKKEAVNDGSTEIKAPLAGVFYASASPELAPYVKVGSKVKKGDILCIIEAMKVMNEINAEHDGEITAVCASNEELVEYNQTIFRIK